MMPESPRTVATQSAPGATLGRGHLSITRPPSHPGEGRLRSLSGVNQRGPVSTAPPSKLKEITNQLAKDFTIIDFNLKALSASPPGDRSENERRLLIA